MRLVWFKPSHHREPRWGWWAAVIITLGLIYSVLWGWQQYMRGEQVPKTWPAGKPWQATDGTTFQLKSARIVQEITPKTKYGPSRKIKAQPGSQFVVVDIAITNKHPDLARCNFILVGSEGRTYWRVSEDVYPVGLISCPDGPSGYSQQIFQVPNAYLGQLRGVAKERTRMHDERSAILRDR